MLEKLSVRTPDTPCIPWSGRTVLNRARAASGTRAKRHITLKRRLVTGREDCEKAEVGAVMDLC